MKLKKLIAFGAIAALALSSNVIANENQVYVNGESLGTCIENCVPLRPVAEALGYDVEWDSKNKSIAVSNLPQYITMTIGVDGYTFAKTAPMPLGRAPFINNGTTFVPAELFCELLNYDVSFDNGDYYISEKTDDEKGYVTISKIDENGILIEDNELGEVLLVISEDTEIADEYGNKKSPEDIKESDCLAVEYGDTMTMSIPPITNPKSITIISDSDESSTEDITETSTEETSSETTTEAEE